jgi:prepilin-type N-terminal cleavage/methylation domain-containing protein
MIKNRKNQKGFTLIELLVVIAIIAVLAVVVVLTLNPAELLRQARDSNRLSDFATMKSAMALYGTDVATTTALGTSTNIYTSCITCTVSTGTMTTSSTAAGWGFLGGETTFVSSTIRSINGTGWIPVNFTAISSGAPIGSLPIDPANSGALMYTYAASSTVYKLATKMESVKYSTNGSGDVESGDGGNSTTTYEQGSNLTGF